MNPKANERAVVGWQLVGTDRWWPAMFGQPPQHPSLRWAPIYRRAA